MGSAGKVVTDSRLLLIVNRQPERSESRLNGEQTQGSAAQNVWLESSPSPGRQAVDAGSARRAGGSRPLVHRWNRSRPRNPSLKAIAKIARGLGMSLEHLFEHVTATVEKNT